MTLEEFGDAIRVWAREPWTFVRQAFGVEPDVWQDEALRAIGNPETERLAMKACKGPGKTALLAWLIWWFLVTRVEPKIGCTSITEANIDTNLWPELAKWQKRSEFLSAAFQWTSTKVFNRAHPENWFAVKRTWPKSGDSQQQADALAGIHADDVMFVLDESGGIPQAVMVTAEAVLANMTPELRARGHRALVVQAGNPTHTTGPLYRACTSDRKLWYVVTITGDPDDPRRSTRISKDWAQQQIDSYGRDNPWVMVNVLGQFPPASINALLGVEEVEAAMKRHLRKEDYNWAQKRLGIDVARFGDDRSTLFGRQGMLAMRPAVMMGVRTTEIAARAAESIGRLGFEVVFVDDSGHWGHGVIDNLITGGYPAIGIFFEGKADDPRYFNKRTEMYFRMAEWVKAGGALPYLPEMIAELTEPTYTFVGGKIQLEPKDQIKERLGKSPDLADGLCLTFAWVDMPAAQVAEQRGANQTLHDYDPYSAPEDWHRQAERGGRQDYDPYDR